MWKVSKISFSAIAPQFWICHPNLLDKVDKYSLEWTFYFMDFFVRWTIWQLAAILFLILRGQSNSPKGASDHIRLENHGKMLKSKGWTLRWVLFNTAMPLLIARIQACVKCEKVTYNSPKFYTFSSCFAKN